MKFSPFNGFDLPGYKLNGEGIIGEGYAHVWIFSNKGDPNFISYYGDPIQFGKEKEFVFSQHDPVLKDYLQDLLKRNLKLQPFL